MAIKYCGCDKLTKGTVYQNDTYGAGMRVQNQCAGKDGKRAYRCTCCGKVNESATSAQSAGG